MFRVVIGMSDELMQIRNKVRDAASQLDEHLIKLVLFPNCDSKLHWRAEIHSCLNKVARVKGSNKFPKYKVLREGLSVYEDMVPEIMQVIKDDYDSLTPSDISSQQVLDCVVRYHDWLAKQLSQHGAVSSKQIFAELESLGL